MATELVTFKIASGWLEKLAKQYKKLIGMRVEALNPIADELLVVPQDLAPVFVEPDLQQYNPADKNDEDEMRFRVPVFGYLEDFIKVQKEKPDGRRHLFILADAGMGKTSILAMFKLGHVNRFWPIDYDCLVIKMGPGTLAKLEDATSRGNTVLLLDGLDEDRTAYGRFEERIIEILNATKNFFRVVITCRNQFLPLGNTNVFPRQDRIKLGGFTCPVKYISPFNDCQVRAYLEKRFPSTWRQKFFFEENEKIPYAEKVISHMDDLRFRPMLLSNIDDLIGENVDSNPYQIYKLLVEKWLDREERKGTGVVPKDLMMACIILAQTMTYEGVRQIEERKLAELLNDHPVLSQLKLADVGGRSLLNRNSDGAYRFTHQSFQEFLVIHALEYGFKGDWIPFQEMSIRFLLSSDIQDLSGINLSKINLGKVNLSGLNLSGATLIETDLSGANLSKTNLCDANLNNADLRGANLIGADLRQTHLHGSEIDDKTLLDYRWWEVWKIINAPMVDRNLSGSKLESADLGRANLSRVNLRQASLIEANLSGADLSKTNLFGANLSGAKLVEANLQWASLIGADLIGTDLHGANLKGAKLIGANLSQSDLNYVENWMLVMSWENANIHGVKNAPDGFIKYVLDKGGKKEDTPLE